MIASVAFVSLDRTRTNTLTRTRALAKVSLLYADPEKAVPALDDPQRDAWLTHVESLGGPTMMAGFDVGEVEIWETALGAPADEWTCWGTLSLGTK